MKYTRLELQSGLSKNTVKNIIVFFIAIPIISIGIGRIITGTLIVPYIGKKIQPVQYTVNIDNEKVKAEYYILQAGVFMNKDNAVILQKGIKDSFIIADSDSYRLVVNIDKDKSNIENIQQDLKKSGYNCIVNNINFDTEKVDTAFSENIKTIIVLLQNEEKAILNIENNKEVSFVELTEQKNKAETEYEKLKTDNKDNKIPENIISGYSKIIKLSDEFIISIKNKKIIDAKCCMTEQLYNTKNLYENFSQSD